MKQKIIITGASGNLGSSIIKKLSKHGYTILGTTNSPASAIALREEGIAATSIDLRDEEAVGTYVAANQSGVVAAILTAGGFAAGNFVHTDRGALREMYSLNFETAYFLVRALLPVFEQRNGGQFILIGSRPALEAKEGKELIAYSLSKRLVFYLAELINEFGKTKNITATVIVPSTINTAANRAAMPQADYSKWVSPEAIADTVYFLLTDSGREIREGVMKLYNMA